MKYFTLISLVFFLISCDENLTEKKIKIYPNGKTEISHFINEKGQVKKVLHFFENGQVEIEGKMDDLGKRHGIWKSYHENGSLWSSGEYHHGIQQGKNRVNFPNGKIRYEGGWDNDIKVGVWQFYDENGTLIKSVDYSTKN